MGLGSLWLDCANLLFNNIIIMGFSMQWPRVRLPPYVVPCSIHTVGAASLGILKKKCQSLKKKKRRKGEKGEKK